MRLLRKRSLTPRSEILTIFLLGVSNSFLSQSRCSQTLLCETKEATPHLARRSTPSRDSLTLRKVSVVGYIRVRLPFWSGREGGRTKAWACGARSFLKLYRLIAKTTRRTRRRGFCQATSKEIDQSVVLPLWSSTVAIRSLDLTDGSSRFEAQDKYARRTQLRCEFTSRYV